MPHPLTLSRAVALLALWCVSSVGVRAEPITSERIAALAEPARHAWEAYRQRSTALAERDAAALRDEVRAAGLPAALAAPSGGDFKLPSKASAAWFASKEAGDLATTVLSYQTPSGGWSKHTGYNRGPRRPGMQWTSQSAPGQAPHYLATFDNRSTTEQLRFLAGVWQATQRDDCRAAVADGLDFVLAAQFPTGGWPQTFPLEGGYHDNITLNDDAMTHVLALLQTVVSGDPAFACVAPAQRARCHEALDAGVRCLLAAQITVQGKKTVWCAQHDALTLQPTAARKMEPASLSGLESARVLEFLMGLDAPDAEVIAAVEAGLAFFERAKITTLSRVDVGGKTLYRINPTSTEVYWARFYDLGTERPLFPGRDGVLYESYEAMVAKNAAGYDYLTTIPDSVLKTGQKNWRKRTHGAAPKAAR